MHLNRIIVSLTWSCLFWAVNSHARPAQYTLKAAFSQSEIVVAATLQRATLVPEVRMSGSRPRGLASPSRFACEFNLKIHFYIKGSRAGDRDELSVMMYSPRPGCTLEAVRGQGGPVNIAVWFLRRESGIYRSVVDNMMALVPIARFPDQVHQEMSKLSGQASVWPFFC